MQYHAQGAKRINFSFQYKNRLYSSNYLVNMASFKPLANEGILIETFFKVNSKEQK